MRCRGTRARACFRGVFGKKMLCVLADIGRSVDGFAAWLPNGLSLLLRHVGGRRGQSHRDETEPWRNIADPSENPIIHSVNFEVSFFHHVFGFLQQNRSEEKAQIVRQRTKGPFQNLTTSDEIDLELRQGLTYRKASLMSSDLAHSAVWRARPFPCKR